MTSQVNSAVDLLQQWCPLPQAAGTDTKHRLTEHIEMGKSPEEAAAREYVYRWHLALKSGVFGVPHTIGM